MHLTGLPGLRSSRYRDEDDDPEEQQRRRNTDLYWAEHDREREECGEERQQRTPEEQEEWELLEMMNGRSGERSAYPQPDLPDRFTYRLAEDVPGSTSKLLLRLPPDHNIRKSQHGNPNTGFNFGRAYVNQYDSVRYLAHDNSEELIATQRRVIDRRAPLSPGYITWRGDNTIELQYGRYRNGPILQQEIAVLYSLEQLRLKQGGQARAQATWMGWPSFYAQFGAPVHYRKTQPHRLPPLQWAKECTETMAGGAFAMRRHMFFPPDFIAQCLEHTAPLVCNAQEEKSPFRMRHLPPEQCAVIRQLQEQMRDLTPEAVGFVIDHTLTRTDLEQERIIDFLHSLPAFLRQGLRMASLTTLIRKVAAAGDLSAAVLYGIDLVQAIYGNGKLPWWFNEKAGLAEQTFDPAETNTPPEGTDAHTWELLTTAQEALGEINPQAITFLREHGAWISIEDIRKDFVIAFLRDLPCLSEQGVNPQRCTMVMDRYCNPERHQCTKELTQRIVDVDGLGLVDERELVEIQSRVEDWKAHALQHAISSLRGELREIRKMEYRARRAGFYNTYDYDEEREEDEFTRQEYVNHKHIPTTWPQEQEMGRALFRYRHGIAVEPNQEGCALSLAMARRAGPLYEYALETYKRAGYQLGAMEGIGQERAIDCTVRVTEWYGIGNPLRATNVLRHVLALIEQTTTKRRSAALEEFLIFLEKQKPVSPMMGILETTTPQTSFQKPCLTALADAFDQSKGRVTQEDDDPYGDRRHRVQERADPLHATPQEVVKLLTSIDRPLPERLRLPVHGKPGIASEHALSLRDYPPPSGPPPERSPSSLTDLQQFHAAFSRLGSYRGPLLAAIYARYCATRVEHPLQPPAWLIDVLDRLERQYPHQGEPVYDDEHTLRELETRFRDDIDETQVIPNGTGPRFSDREELRLAEEQPYRTLSRLLDLHGLDLLAEEDVKTILAWVFAPIHLEVTEAVQAKFQDDPRSDATRLPEVAERERQDQIAACQFEIDHLAMNEKALGYSPPNSYRLKRQNERRKEQLEADSAEARARFVEEVRQQFHQEVTEVLGQCQTSLQSYRLHELRRTLDRVATILQSGAQQHFATGDIAAIVRAGMNSDAKLTPNVISTLPWTEERVERQVESAKAQELTGKLAACVGPDDAHTIVDWCTDRHISTGDPILHESIAHLVAQIGQLLVRNWGEDEDEEEDRHRPKTVAPEVRTEVQKQMKVVSALLRQMAGLTDDGARQVVHHILAEEFQVNELAAIAADVQSFPTESFGISVKTAPTEMEAASLRSTEDSFRCYVFLLSTFLRRQMGRVALASHLSPTGMPFNGDGADKADTIDTSDLPIPSEHSLHALTLPVRRDLQQALRAGTLTRKEMRTLISDHIPPFAQSIRESRETVKGMSPIGGKAHTHSEMGAAQINVINAALGWNSTGFRLLHALKSANLPPVPTTEEFELRVWVLNAGRVLNQRHGVREQPELQVCCPGRLSLRNCGVLATSYLLAASRAIRYVPEDFQTTVGSGVENGAIISYDAQGARASLPFSWGTGRTDVLGVLEPADARIIQAVHTACMHAEHNGPFAEAGKEYIRRHEEILGDHSHLLDAPWTYNPYTGVYGAGNPQVAHTFLGHAELAVIPTQNLYFDAINQWARDPNSYTLFHAVRDNIDTFRLAVQSNQPVLNTREDWRNHAQALIL
ncbi:MAG: hypothetical protein PHZ00_00495 [Candidatus Peribacteraceae bacterium]|nr:hypothetical protein [Candidatus Peribacteraceae bacterium]